MSRMCVDCQVLTVIIFQIGFNRWLIDHALETQTLWANVLSPNAFLFGIVFYRIRLKSHTLFPR